MTLKAFQTMATRLTLEIPRLSRHHLTPEQHNYITTSPSVRRNMEKRITLAIAQTFLTPEQIEMLNLTEETDPQIPTTPNIEEPEP